MIKQFWWGMGQYCRRCAAKGYPEEDCWWPANDGDFWPRMNTGARVTQFRGECKACVNERKAKSRANARENVREAA
jgi:hypothetical protein